MTTAEDRAVGALVGLACGDAVGTTLEFKAPGSFSPITDMVGGGPFRLKAGEWTDDTSLGLCLAESILDVGELDAADQLRRFLLWRFEGYLASNGLCFDIGGTTSAALERFRRSGAVTDAAPNEHDAANGSLMRLAAVPIRWHADIAEAAARSGESSRTTHPASLPVDACRVLGATIAALIVGVDGDDVLASSFWRWGSLAPEVEAVARGSWQTKDPPSIKGTGYCVDALEAALWAVAGAATFEGAVLRAANLGDDADTTAAIAGQIAGARWGASSIPAHWRNKLVARARIEEIARQLFIAGGGTLDDSEWPHDAFIHAWWATPDVLAGEYPGHWDTSRAQEKVNLLVDAGIRTFIDLTTPADGLDSYDDHVAMAAERRQLDLWRLTFPIPDLGVVDDDIYDDALAEITAATARGGVYVHCWGGIGRTGTVVACLLGRNGATYEEVIEQIASARAATHKARRRSPETDVQHELLRRRLGVRG
jgi:ADP-ribosyl-[dinitrogen reductase] hydrolase